METVRSLSRLKVLMNELSRNLNCGESIRLKLSSPQLLTQLPQIAMSVNLSFIDAEEVKGGFIVTLENRFGEKCFSGD